MSFFDDYFVPKIVRNWNGMPSKIQLLRLQLDSIDSTLIELLAERMKISREIGDIKHQSSMEIEQPEIWFERTLKRAENSKKVGLNHQFVEQIFELIHTESKNNQKR